jgi:transcriptional regulator with XRE-family HTH domain
MAKQTKTQSATGREFKPFRCVECGDQVRLLKKAGRVEEYRRGVPLPIPEDFAIPTCPTCGEEYFTVELSEALAKLQAPLFAEWQRAHCEPLVDRIRKAHEITLRELEEACGVTGTYLSHVLAGRKEASLTLIRLLEAYAAAPKELARQLGKPAASSAKLQKSPRRATVALTAMVKKQRAVRGTDRETTAKQRAGAKPGR